VTKPIDVGREHLVHQGPPVRCELAEDDSLVFGGRSPSHQSTFFKLFDDVRGARPRDEDPIPNLAEGQSALVIQHLEDRELGQAQATIGEMWPYAPFKRLHGSAERDDQLQGRGPIAIGVQSLFSLLRRHDI
jgi:hypothetical protein